MGYLKQIVVENFKSWRGQQMFPFTNFSCIIGPNGSGKSNVMDAVSFAIGERASVLRVKHLRDLIHGSQTGQPVSGRTSVTLFYYHDQDLEIQFSRSISGDSSEYLINGNRTTFNCYAGELSKIGIITKAQNCLVFQGTVESIALQNPIERCKLFELISHSKEFLAEYNEKKEAMLKAKEDTHFQFTKKKSVAVESKQMSDEKLEAQKYQSLVDDIQQKRLQLSLAVLYHNEKAIERTSNTQCVKQRAVAAQNATLQDWEETVKTLKKDHGRLVREQQLMEKEIRAQELVVSQSRSHYINTKVNTSHHLKKMDELQALVKNSQKTLARIEQELTETQLEKTDLENTWKVCTEQFLKQRMSQGRDIELDGSQRERYRDLKDLAMKQNAVLYQKSQKIGREVKAEYDQLAFDQRKRNEVEDSIKNNKSELDNLTRKAEKLEEYTKKSRIYTCICRSSLDDFHQKEEHLQAELQSSRERANIVQEELKQVLDQVGDACLERTESKHQLRRKDMLEKMQRLFTDSVYGRLCDLCTPIHKRYRLAVTKVFGHFMKAIVVTTQKTAEACIKMLREERAEPETFLPIDYLDVRPLNERLREIPGAMMVVDVVLVNVNTSVLELRRVVQFVCGNTLVCETTKDARSIAFDEKERQKTVSLDGTLFSKSGVISGGTSDLRFKARCWDDNDVTRLKHKKQQLTDELKNLMRHRRKESDLNEIILQANGLKTRLKYSKSELDLLVKQSIPKCLGDISRLESELANLNCQIQMQLQSVNAKEDATNNLKDQIQQTEDTVFSNFCAEIGVGNIREYEQEQLKHQEEHDEKRLEFENQCSRLNAKMEYEKEQLKKQKKKLSKIQASIHNEESNMAQKKKEEEKHLMAVGKNDNKLLEMKNQLLEKKNQVASAKSDIDEKIPRLHEMNRELVKLQQEVLCAESRLEQNRLSRHNLLLACKLYDQPIILQSGDLNEVSQLQLEEGLECSSVTTDIFERESQLVIDYSCLEAESKDMPEEEVENYLKMQKDSLDALEELLKNTAKPNFKAVEKLRKVKDKLQDVTDAFKAATISTRNFTYEYGTVKHKRSQLFNKCFNHVSSVIDGIYKRICQNNSAQAILSADNPEEPYLGGINYSCVAPGKRYMPIENLSGGERAIASLALLFAIYSFRPAPFLILDEVDASLDNSNIERVTTFIREQSQEKMQVIAISLKDEFFSRADTLLGVYMDFDKCTFSRLLTLDLRHFPLLGDNVRMPARDNPEEDNLQ
ncbi:structural maintenance of chromosomes protein 1B isoform X2 [Stigmatopora argus]